MLRKPLTQQIFLLLLIIGLALPGASVRAQDNQAFTEIIAPDYSNFPIITSLLDVFDDQGQSVEGLAPANVTILENGQKVVPDSVQRLEAPLGVVVAINSGMSLGVRDAQGNSRYEKLAAVISNWAAARPDNSQDDISLAWNGGVVASHFSPSAWRNRFDSFDPSPRTSQPGLAALSFALDAAQNIQAGAGEKKAILLVSGRLENDSLDKLKDLIERAKQAKVRVNVWIIDTSANLTLPGALALEDLASQTGGHSLAFSGSETLPDPETWFAPLRHLYRLTYTSKIRAAGQQSLSVQVNAAGLALTSRTVSFQLDVEPPSPALLSAPIQIVRQNPDRPFDIETFLPRQQEISALIEFPDKYPRKLTRTTLYVDDQKVAENTTAPFDKFTWDLSAYVASGDHSLEVEAEDELGLIRKSPSVPVKVIVAEPPGGIAGLLLRNGTALTISLIVLAGVVLLLILFLGGRRFASLAERRRARARELDPVTQPVNATVEPRGLPRANPFPWLRRRSTSPPAYFVKLTADGQPAPGDPITLHHREITFGADPTQASVILDHPSVSPLHARLHMNENGDFQLLDQDSVAGTWVNFEPISKDGRFLKHGDMVNFGQFTYRFVLSKAPATPQPTITPSTKQ